MSKSSFPDKTLLIYSSLSIFYSSRLESNAHLRVLICAGMERYFIFYTEWELICRIYMGIFWNSYSAQKLIKFGYDLYHLDDEKYSLVLLGFRWFLLLQRILLSPRVLGASFECNCIYFCHEFGRTLLFFLHFCCYLILIKTHILSFPWRLLLLPVINFFRPVCNFHKLNCSHHCIQAHSLLIFVQLSLSSDIFLSSSVFFFLLLLFSSFLLFI